MEIRVPNGKYQSVARDNIIPNKYAHFCDVSNPKININQREPKIFVFAPNHI